MSSTSDKTHRFRVLILGPFAVFHGDRSLETGTWPPRAQSLLKMVVTAPEHRRPRDEIIDSLWPEAAPEAGAANLRYTLHLLRRMFGGIDPSPILSEKHLIALSPAYDWEIDLARLEELVRTPDRDLAALERAAELYRGEPLIEDRYADWAIPARDHAARVWRDLCLRLASLHRAGAAQQKALEWFERVLESDSLDEEAILGVLAMLSALNRPVEAARRYQQFADRLDEELGVAPGPELLAVAEQIKSQSRWPALTDRPVGPRMSHRSVPVIPTYPLPATGSLVGRDVPLRTILSALQQVVDADKDSVSSRVILIAAEAGMGKTRLLAEMAERARAEGILTLAGGCYEQEGRLPYGPFHDALSDYIRSQPETVLRFRLDGLPDELGRIVSGLPTRDDDAGEKSQRDATGHRTQLFSAVADMLERVSADRPLLLLLDDLQWADDASLHLLHYLARQTGLHRVLITGAYRSDELLSDAPLALSGAGADARDDVHILNLEPLSENALASLLEERIGGRCTPGFVRDLHERGAGNPFFALQIFRLLQESDRLVQSPVGWEAQAGTPFELPPVVHDTIIRRLRRLDADEREALTLGSVLGREFDYAPLEAMWEGDERSLFHSLDAAADAHLVHETESGYAFAHPLLWEVTYRRIPVPRRALLHERAGLRLEEIYGEAVTNHAAELAHHFLSAGRVHLNRVVRYLTLAGDAAARVYAWEDALGAYTQALERSRDEATVARLQEKRGQALKSLARHDEALEALEEAARRYRLLDDPEGEGRATALLALVHHFRRSWVEGALRVPPVVERLERRGISRHTLALLYAALPRVYLFSGREHEGLVAAERAVALAEETGDQEILADAVFVRGRALVALERWGEGVEVLAEAIQLSKETGDLFILAAALHYTAHVEMRLGHLLQARAHFEQALEAAERRGGVEHMGDALFRLADLHTFLGNWSQAARYLQRGFSLLGPRTPVWVDRALAEISAILSLYQGDWSSLRQNEALRKIAAQRDTLDIVAVRANAVLAELELLTDKPNEALVRLRFLAGQPVADSDPRFLVPLAWAYIEGGDLTAADEFLAKGYAAATGRRTYLPDVLRVEGMLRARKGEYEAAGAAFSRAVEEAHTMPYPYSQARALYEWGRMLIQQGEIAQARERLAEALGIFERLGARPYIERTKQALSVVAAQAGPRS